MTKGWKKIDSIVAYKNPWYQVREDRVIQPNGKEGKYCVIEDKDSVSVVAVGDDGKIYLVGQTRYPIGNIFSWETICGGINPGVAPLEIAKIELEEEAGLQAEEWIDLGHYFAFGGISSIRISVFLARKLIKVKSKHEATEDIKIKKMTLKEVNEAINKNEIIDGPTIVSINKYSLFQE